MINKNISDILQILGLNPLEIACYIELLKKSPQRATEIARKTESPRATVHVALAQLADTFGVIHRSKRKNVFEFSVEDPSDLNKIIKRRQSAVTNQKKGIEKLLPELRSLQQFDASKPQITYVEGKEGIKNTFLQILDEADEIIGYGSNEDDIQYLPNIFPRYYEARVKKKIPVTAIIPATDYNIKETIKNETNHLRHTHLIPKELNFPIQINLFKNKSIIFSLEENFALIIKNKPIADCLKKVFEYAYSYTEHIDEEIRSRKETVTK